MARARSKTLSAGEAIGPCKNARPGERFGSTTNDTGRLVIRNKDTHCRNPGGLNWADFADDSRSPQSYEVSRAVVTQLLSGGRETSGRKRRPRLLDAKAVLMPKSSPKIVHWFKHQKPEDAHG
jgi:hypothetical protein